MSRLFVLRAGCVRVCVAELDRCVTDAKKSHAMNTSSCHTWSSVFDFFFNRLFLRIFQSIPVTTVQQLCRGVKPEKPICKNYIYVFRFRLNISQLTSGVVGGPFFHPRVCVMSSLSLFGLKMDTVTSTLAVVTEMLSCCSRGTATTLLFYRIQTNFRFCGGGGRKRR